jgi:hydroxymethylpyrimidine pyrophosphatase-like HAD family hydrolase
MPKIADPLTVVGIGPKMGFGDLQQAVENRLQCNIFSYPVWIERKSDLHGFDFVQPGVGKGVALAALAAHLGLEMSQTLAIGDSLNDLDMLKVAGLSVAMGNATPELKKVSHAIVGSNNEDGVAEAIERFVLE